MMDAIATLIQRLCACGLLCGVALSLVKHSGQEGILRLCCACLMVVAKLYHQWLLQYFGDSRKSICQWEMLRRGYCCID